MSKLLVEVLTPGNGKTYEFRIDGGISGLKAKQKIIEQILEVEAGGITLNPEKCLLFHIKSGKKLSNGLALSAQSIRSGSTLLLV